MAHRMAALQKAIFNLCLMAICYRYLGETQLMHDTLECAKKAQTQNIWTMRLRDMGGAKGVIKSLAQVGGSWLNPSSYSILLKFDRGLIPEIETNALEQFCTVLQSSE